MMKLSADWARGGQSTDVLLRYVMVLLVVVAAAAAVVAAVMLASR